MAGIEDYILGDNMLHERFFAMTEIFAKMISSAPRGVRLAHLEKATNQPAAKLRKACLSLEEAGLLRRDPVVARQWLLGCDPCLVTLEDVFRCALIEQLGRTRPGPKTNPGNRIPNDVDLFITQAVLAVNQSVFKHLRQFSLARLSVATSSIFPAANRSLRKDAFDASDPCHTTDEVAS